MNPEFVIRSFTAFLDANKIPAASVLPTVVSCLIDEKFYIATPKLLIEASKISRRSGTMARLKFRVAEQLMREYDAVEGEDFFNIRYHQLNEDLLALYRKGEIPRAACMLPFYSPRAEKALAANKNKMTIHVVRGSLLKKILCTPGTSNALLSAAWSMNDAFAGFLANPPTNAVSDERVAAVRASMAAPGAVCADAQLSDEQHDRLVLTYTTFAAQPKRPVFVPLPGEWPLGKSFKPSGAACFLLMVSDTVVEEPAKAAFLLKATLGNLRGIGELLVRTTEKSFYLVAAFALPSKDDADWDGVTTQTIIERLVQRKLAVATSDEYMLADFGKRKIDRGDGKRKAALLGHPTPHAFIYRDENIRNSGHVLRSLVAVVSGVLRSFLVKQTTEINTHAANALYNVIQRNRNIRAFLLDTFVFFDKDKYEKMPVGHNDRKTWTDRMAQLPGVQTDVFHKLYVAHCDRLDIPEVLRVAKDSLVHMAKNVGLRCANGRILLIRTRDSCADDITEIGGAAVKDGDDVLNKPIPERGHAKKKIMFDPLLLCNIEARAVSVELARARKRKPATASSSSAANTPAKKQKTGEELLSNESESESESENESDD